MKSRSPAASVAARILGVLSFAAAAGSFAADAPQPGKAPAGSAEAGAAKAAVCGACHGLNGNSVNPEWPNLAGQHTSYTIEQLTLFKGMVRTNPIMQAQAMPLEPQDMADLAAYFAAQTLTGLEADPSLVEVGQKLWRGGDAKRGIPACIGCHGPEGRGNAPARWPKIGGQHSLYVYNQLKSYAANARYVPAQGQPAPPPQAEMMNTVASRLTDADMKALASYVQGLR